jgi:thioredoxin-related protein
MDNNLKSFTACPVEHINVETEKGEELSEKYGIMSLPTMILVDKVGEALYRWTGITPIKDIEFKIAELC